ncbi:MAG: hypothetical protein Q4E55_02755 [Bacteroidales bacterium]|nr:hypothetical protein [Bacteroidales bacterium]
MNERRLFQGKLIMRNYEEIFNRLPEYVGGIWWQEHFAKKFEGTLMGSYQDVSPAALRTLAEELKEGLERASAEASDFISSANTKGDMTRWLVICSNLASERCPHIDFTRLSLTYYQEKDKWLVETIGVNSEFGYQSSCPLIYYHEDVVRDFLASDEFIVVCTHQLFKCDKEIAECERDVRSW